MSIIETAPVVLEGMWGVEPDPLIIENIVGFGVEYEMFEDNDSYGDGDYCCTFCNGPRDEWDENHPRSDEPRGIVGRFLSSAKAAGLTSSDYLHDYHCNCETCSYTRSEPIMCSQADGTVGAEMVSRILRCTNPDDLDELGRWVDFMQEWKNSGGWMPDGQASCGNHIHVERLPGVYGQDYAERAVGAAYVAYDWRVVADGGCGALRGYNRKPGTDDWSYGTGSTNWGRRRTHTVEHRLWNTPRDPERLWVHVGLSIALTRWSIARRGIFIPSHSLVSEFHAHIDDFKRDVIAYLPDDARFQPAAQLLTDHLVNY